MYNQKFFMQKFNYIHHNPASGKWNLANDYSDYEHSTASCYEAGIAKSYQVFDFRSLWCNMQYSEGSLATAHVKNTADPSQTHPDSRRNLSLSRRAFCGSGQKQNAAGRATGVPACTIQCHGDTRRTK